MTDYIVLEDIELWTHIGVPEEERACEQRVLVSVSIETDTVTTAKNDDIAGAIDYANIAQELQILARTQRKTLECLAENIAQTVLQHPAAISVSVSAHKFVLPGVRSVSIQIHRHKH